MAKPILIFDAIFENTAINLAEKVFEYPKDEDLELWINSPGGSVTHGYSMLAALDQRKKETKKDNNMTVVGDASSMAFIMLLFADKTRAYDTSNFLVHRAASWWEDIMTDEELADIEARNKVIRKKLEARIDKDKFEKVTGKTFNDIFSMEDRLDVRLNAKQAKDIGLIDEIIKLNPKKMAEIESNYYHEIAALSSTPRVNSITNSNKQKKNMGLFSKAKDPVFLAEVGDKQIVYTKLETGESVKAVGEDVAISGTFEKDNKEITVVENEITAVKEVNQDAKRIEALEDKVGVLIATVEKMVDAPPPVEEKKDETIKALEEKVEKLSDVIAKAKLSISDPNLPQGEFKEVVKEEPVSAKKRFKKNLKEGTK